LGKTGNESARGEDHLTPKAELRRSIFRWLKVEVAGAERIRGSEVGMFSA
jgi:hypothetical protein